MLKNNASDDDELVFALELDSNLEETHLHFITRQYMQLTQSERQAPQTTPTEESSFYPNLVIPDNFWDSPLPSPTQWERYHDTFFKSGYSNFTLFVQKVLYPELMQIYQMNANQIISEKSSDKSGLVDLNYKVMLELCEIVENMNQYSDRLKDTDLKKSYGVFFKACENFLNEYDAVLQKAVFKKSHDKEGLSFYDRFKSILYESMKAHDILDELFLALKSGLILADDRSELAILSSSSESTVYSFPKA